MTLRSPIPRSAVPARLPVLVLALALCWAPGATAQAPDPVPAEASASAAPLADARLAFTRGVLAFHDGDFEAARERFREAVRLAPDDGTASYWLGLAELNLGRPAEAAAAIRRALDAPEPPAADRSEVLARLEQAEAAAPGVEEAVPAPGWGGDFRVLPEVPPWDLRLSLAAGTDSNPNLLGDDLVLATPDGEVVEGEESDTVVLGDVRFGLQGADEEREVVYGVVLRGHQSLNSDFDYLDLARVGVTGQLAWGADPLGYLSGPFGYSRVPMGRSPVSVLLQAGAERHWLDGDVLADGLLAAGTLAVREGGRGQTQLEVSWRKLDFDEAPRGFARPDDTELRATLAQYLYLGRRDRYLRLDATAGERDAGLPRDASLTAAGAELSLPLAERLVLYVTGAWEEEDFDEPESNPFTFTGPPREDETVRLGGSLVWRALDRLFVSGRATWTDRDIGVEAPFSVPDLSYQRTVATVGVSWIF